MSNILPTAPPLGIAGATVALVAQSRSAANYRPHIDGLRAIAVVSVILFHLGYSWAPGGFVGVDVFFVISGFLITRILVRDLEEGRFSLVCFYDRRIRRLFPAYAAVMMATFVVSLVVLWPADLSRFGADLVATAVSLSNVQFARNASYFSPNADLNPLLHTWSLAVEEQFYVIFPLALWGLWRTGKAHLRCWLWIGLLLSLSLGIWATGRYPKLAFFLLPSRGWELLVGSLLALRAVPSPAARWQRELAAIFGLGLVAAAVSSFDSKMSFPGVAAVVPCLGAALIIWAGPGARQSAGLVAGALASRWLVFVGLISYSLYLWHWPLIVFTKHVHNGVLSDTMRLGLLAGTFFFASLSWWIIERPFRSGRLLWPTRRSRFAIAALLVAALIVAGIMLRVTEGLPGRIPPLVALISESSRDYSPHRNTCHGDGTPAWRFENTCSFGPDPDPAVIVFADSHGVELSDVLAEALVQRGLSLRQITASGCPPSIGFNPPDRPQCAVYVSQMIDKLSQRPAALIIMTAYYFSFGFGERADMFWSGLNASVATLTGAGHKVILVGAIPPHPNRIPLPSALARWVQFGRTPEAYRFAVDGSKISAVNASLSHISLMKGVQYFPLHDDLWSAQEGGRGFLEGAVLYFDDNHLSLAGARLIVRNRLLQAVVAMFPDAQSASPVNK